MPAAEPSDRRPGLDTRGLQPGPFQAKGHLADMGAGMELAAQQIRLGQGHGKGRRGIGGGDADLATAAETRLDQPVEHDHRGERGHDQPVMDAVIPLDTVGRVHHQPRPRMGDGQAAAGQSCGLHPLPRRHGIVSFRYAIATYSHIYRPLVQAPARGPSP